jgi:hypothetical protein
MWNHLLSLGVAVGWKRISTLKDVSFFNTEGYRISGVTM